MILNESIWTIERGLAPRHERLRFIGQTRECRKAKDRVDRLDDGIVVAFSMRDSMNSRVRRNHDERHANPPRQWQAIWAIGQDTRRNMIIETVRLIVSNDDHASLPNLGILGNGVDDAGGHRLADLPVTVARMVVVSSFRRGNCLCFGGGRSLANVRRLLGDIAEAAANIKNASLRWKSTCCHIIEKIAEAAQIAPQRRVIRDIAKILRRFMMAHIAVM